MADYVTTGSVEQLSAGRPCEEFQPVVQIMDFKVLSKPNTPDRYRLNLSDGVNSMSFALVATQLNKKMEAVAKHSTIKLLQFKLNHLDNGKAILMVLDFDLVTSGDSLKLIGQPSKISSESIAAAGSTASNNMVNAPSKRPIAGQNSDGPQAKTPLKNHAYVTPIAELTPYQNKWTVRARVVSKSMVRTFSNARGEGKFFNMVLTDESGVEIKCTAWTQECEKFFDLIDLDKVYYISRGQLKTANKKFTTVNNDYEMALTADSQIEFCTDQTNLPGLKFVFVPIADLANIAPNNHIDVVGVATSIDQLRTVTAKQSQREIPKRDVTICDQSMFSVRVTLWGEEARTFTETNDEPPVVAFKAVKVSDWDGRSLSCVSSSMMRVNSMDIPEVHELRGWYDSVGSNQEFKSHGSGGFGSQGGSGRSDPWKTLGQVKQERLGLSEKPDYFRSVATVSFIKKENALYKACPTERCNKKLIELGNDSYRCEKCQSEVSEFRWRTILRASILDNTDGQWITLFQEPALCLLGGITAEHLGELSQADEDGYQAVFEAALFQTFEFKLMARHETYNDETRSKLVCLELRPLNMSEVNDRLIEDIEKMAVM